MAATSILINGEWHSHEEAALSVHDLQVQRGYGIFDFFKLKDGRPCFLDDHLQRLAYSASRMRLQIPDPSLLQNWIDRLIQKNALQDEGIRITLTGGQGQNLETGDPVCIIQPQKFRPLAIDEFEKGWHLAGYQHQRQLPDVKTTDYLMAIWLKPWILSQGADEVLYHQEGWITECPRCNIFMVSKEGVLRTPAAQVLAGITRNKIIGLAHHAGLAVEEAPVHLNELQEAAEVFITSTTKGILPVTKLNGTAVANGQPGFWTRKLLMHYNQLL